MGFLQTNSDWGSNPFSRLPQQSTIFPNNVTGVVATPVPAGAGEGQGVLGGSQIIGSAIQHVKIVVPASAASQHVVQFPHGLGYQGDVWAPTAIWAIMEQADASTPSAFYNVIWSKTTNQVISMQFSASGTWHVFYA